MPHRREAKLRDFAELLSARITEVRDEGAAREQNKETFRMFADTLPCIVWTATAEGDVTWFNRRWHDIIGEDWLDWRTLLHPDDQDSTINAWNGAVNACVPYCHSARIRDASGAFHPIVSRAHPIRDEAGRVLYWIGSSSVVEQALPQRQVA